jgi:hypothetical protein
MTYRVTSAPDKVEAWSSVRLPFEPKGWLVDFRNDIRRAIVQLEPSGESLYARFSSADMRPCDIENILFYNVGPGNFSSLMANGVVFERGLEAPKSADELGYHMLYETMPYISDWAEGKPVASWQTNLDPQGTGHPNFSPAYVWWMMKTESHIVTHANLQTPIYGLEIEVQVPIVARFGLAGRMKSLLDGLISAFHCYDGVRLDEVCSRLGSLLSQDPEHIKRLLIAQDHACLGPRQLVWPYRTSVQWNPADDVCYVCRIKVKPGDWRMTGTLFNIEKAFPST